MKALVRFPWVMLVLGAACFVVAEGPPLQLSWGFSKKGLRKAENYPLSSFPMYSVFSDSPIYVYLADGEGNPIASQRDLGVRTSVLKKAYDKEIRKVKAAIDVDISEMTADQKRPAGDATLRLVRRSLAPDAFAGGQFPRLRLYEVTMTFAEDGSIHEQLALVGDVQIEN